jgi:hypothetical protein
MVFLPQQFAILAGIEHVGGLILALLMPIADWKLAPSGNQTGLIQEKYLAIKQAKQKSFRWRNIQQQKKLFF